MLYQKKWQNWKKHSAVLLAAVITLTVLFGTSCRSTKEISSNLSLVENTAIVDSTNILIKKTVQSVVTPKSEIKINVTPEELDALPAGGEFQDKKGNATVSAKKEQNGTITITASCDSLVLLLEKMKKEVYHFQSENTALKTKQSEQKMQIIKEPSGWQWFQIWLGRVSAAALLLYVIYMIIKRHLKR